MQQSILQTGNLSCSSLQFKALYFTVEVTQNYGNLPEKKVSTSLSTFRYLITENHQPMPGIILVNYCWHESYEPQRQETYFRTCASSEDSDQPAHLRRLIRIFAVCIFDDQCYKLSSNRRWRLWSDRAEAQEDSSLPWTHVMEGRFSHCGVLIFLPDLLDRTNG